MKLLAWLPVVSIPILLVGAHSEAAWGLSATQVSQIAEAITVRIDGQNPGSGVLIRHQGDTYTLLTAAHVVATEDEYEIVTADDQRHTLPYQNVTKLPGIDLALVEFQSNRAYQVATLGHSESVQRGESVYISGFPMTNQAITQPILTFSPGSITAHAKHHPLADGYGLVYTNKTLPGMSGGAVLDTEGELIGIHGRADTEQRTQETETIYIKTGFNLGIPLYTYLAAAQNVISPVAIAAANTPPTAEDWYLNGGAKSQQQDFPGAIEDINQAIALEPNFGEAYYRRYYARNQLGDPGAIADLQRSLQLLNQDLDQAEQKQNAINDKINSILNKQILSPE